MPSPSVFISSTYIDLKEVRSGIEKFLVDMKYSPRLFENGGVGFQSEDELDKDCYKAISECDFFLLIIGNRYGSPSSNNNRKSSKFDSVSRLEFRKALEENTPIFVFVKTEVSLAYETFCENKFSKKINYAGIEDNQILVFLKEVYEKIGSTNFIFNFNEVEDITNNLKSQFASIVKDYSKKYKKKKKNSKQTRLNAIRLWYEINQDKKKSVKTVGEACGISELKMAALTKMKWNETKRLTAGCFPQCSYEELSKLEAYLKCEGQFRVGQKNDFQHFYLNAYCKRFEKKVRNTHPQKFKANGFRVKSIVFDFDGTMTTHKLSTWETIWKLLGYPDDLCGKYHGQFRRREITHEEWCRISVKMFQQKGFSRDQLNTISSKLLLRDDFKDVINELYNDGFSLHILSGSIREVISITLSDVYRCFRSVSANGMEFDGTGLISKINSTKYDFEGKADYITDRVIADENLHPLEVLYIGNSSNDVWVSNSGVRTLCVDPKLTDPDERGAWGDKIQNFKSARQILEHVYKGSLQL